MLLSGVLLLIFCCNCGLVAGEEKEIETDSVAALARATYKHENYNRNALPLKRKSMVNGDRIVVNVSFSIRQIHDIDEFYQIMLLSVWQREYWIDDYITWNPDDYRGVKVIRVDANEIWTPDLVLATSGSDEMKPMMERVRTIINYKGEVTYSFPILYHVACEMDMR